MILLVEITGYTEAAVSQVYRYSTGAYITQPGDSPSSTWFDPRVIDPGSITCALPSGRQQPRAEVGFGIVTISNADGALDAVFGSGAVSFRERQVRVLSIEPGASYSTAVVLLVATVAQIELSDSEVAVSIKDATYKLASPHLTATYGGTNALPAGVDGSTELAGKLKPVLYGIGLKIEPVTVNTSRLIYQVSTRPLLSVTGVYDGGSPYAFASDVATSAALEALSPSPGTYATCLAAGLIRLGSSPILGLRVDATADSNPNSTPAQLLKRLALDRGWPSGDILAADVTALDALTTARCGIWIDDSRSTLDAMDIVAQAAGAVYWVDRVGALRMARMALPSGTAADAVADWKTAAVTQMMSGEDAPTETVRIRYARYSSAQSPNQLATNRAIVTDADVADLGQEWRASEYKLAPTPNPHARLLTIERETALTSKADAEAEALRLHGLYAAPRRTHRCQSVYLDPASLLALDLNSVIELRWPRYGFDREAGTLRRVVGITRYLRDLRADLTLWGA